MQRHILLPALTGTAAMTAYSYSVSYRQKKDFREPVLLGKMMARLFPFLGKSSAIVAGWICHHAVGLLFCELYAPFWSETNGAANAKRGLVLGGLSGIAAILIWKFTLSQHPNPPAVDFPKFAGQLFIAHIIFGLFSALGFQLSKSLLPAG